jgi:GcrA cell cycle regulator
MSEQNNTWTPARIGMLQELWGSGLSAKEIAARLGSGITRNAVIGKAHRLGLSSRPSPIKRMADKPAGAAGIKTRATAPKAMGIRRDVNANAAFNQRAMFKETDVDARRGRSEGANYQPRVFKSSNTATNASAQQCRWPMGDPLKAGFHFCERMSIPGMSYCYDHACLAYQGSKKKSPTAPKEEGVTATADVAETPVMATTATH